MLTSLVPTAEQLKAGIEAFYKNERRSRAYFVALSRVRDNWGAANEMANGAKFLLDSWHINFYRFGPFSFLALSDCIDKNRNILEIFKKRNITKYLESDDEIISLLFKDFLEALKGGKNGNCRSPVAVSKTIHLFAPSFFPLWDNFIALHYETLWGSAYSGISQYISFSHKIREVITMISEYECLINPVPIRSALKILDEYNYSKFTKKWI